MNSIPPTLGGKTPPAGGVDLSNLAQEEVKKEISREQILHLSTFDFAPGRTPDGQLAVHLQFDQPLSPMTNPAFFDRTTVVFDERGFRNYADQVNAVVAMIDTARAAEEQVPEVVEAG